jgi:hypothetical protein
VNCHCRSVPLPMAQVLRDADEAMRIMTAQVGVQQTGGYRVRLIWRHAGGLEQGAGEGEQCLGREGWHRCFLGRVKRSRHACTMVPHAPTKLPAFVKPSTSRGNTAA